MKKPPASLTHRAKRKEKEKCENVKRIFRSPCDPVRFKYDVTIEEISLLDEKQRLTRNLFRSSGFFNGGRISLAPRKDSRMKIILILGFGRPFSSKINC